MPWKDKTVNEQRKDFVECVLKKEKSKSALCREYGISRPTGDKWLKRYANNEPLEDNSHRPFHMPNRIAPEVENAIVEARRKEPAIGAKKTKRMLENEGLAMPAMSTINAVFQRNGLITKEASQAATPYQRFEKTEPNAMWQLDFKGDFELRDGTRCYPLSIIDDYSRFCINGDIKQNQQLMGVKDSFVRAFEEYGMPFSLLCDNGTPWGSSQSSSITKFEVWMMELGILTTHIRAKRPQTQGKVERFNGSYKQERLKFYIPENMADAQKTREEYIRFYNNIRPHAAIDYSVPAARYSPSNRPFPSSISDWEYATGTDLRRIKSSGYLTYSGKGFYLSEGLANKQIAVIPSDEDGVFSLVLRQFRVAKLNLNTNTISSRRIYLLEGDPRQKL
ncbi:MAG: IS481 family transposase [Oscillospiraceae bacterium]